MPWVRIESGRFDGVFFSNPQGFKIFIVFLHLLFWLGLDIFECRHSLEYDVS